MGNYNDFDLDLKMVQENGDAGAASITIPITIYTVKHCTEDLSCNNTCSCVDTCKASCGGLTASCSGHCR